MLASLIADYERRTIPAPKSTPDERLRFIVSESGTSQAKLGTVLGLSQPATSLVLSGKRSLTTDAVKRLAEHYKLNPSYFL
ncbi:MAG: helix-turn-helix domain-containing protein [Tepidisphaeraceae bacterium]